MVFALQDQKEPCFHLTRKKAYGPEFVDCTQFGHWTRLQVSFWEMSCTRRCCIKSSMGNFWNCMFQKARAQMKLVNCDSILYCPYLAFFYLFFSVFLIEFIWLTITAIFLFQYQILASGRCHKPPNLNTPFPQQCDQSSGGQVAQAGTIIVLLWK